MKSHIARLLLLALLPSAALRAADLAPDSIAGLTADAIITAGSGFFANTGAYRLTISATTLVQAPITSNIFAQSFTYTYRKTGTATAQVVFTDSATGLIGTENLTFETQARAAFTITSAVGNQSGKLVLEYAPPAATATTPKLINLSTRSDVPSGGALIAGFVVSGGTKTLLIRGAGPSLAQFNVSGFLGDPVLEIYDSSSRLVAQNDDWGNGSPTLSTAFSSAGAFPWAPGSRDSAVQVTLLPGSYTAQIKSKNGQSGSALVEVYELP